MEKKNKFPISSGITKLKKLYTPDALADLLGLKSGTVYSYYNGWRRPAISIAFRIEKKTRGKVTARSVRPDVEGL